VTRAFVQDDDDDDDEVEMGAMLRTVKTLAKLTGDPELEDLDQKLKVGRHESDPNGHEIRS
jgi:hypothetical protein